MVFRKTLQSSRSICLFLMMAILAGMLFGFKPLLSLEQKAYDRMATLRQRAAGIPVIIVAIDDKSLKSIGDWPWPRSYIADIINTLAKNGARIQGVSILYRGRELNDGLAELKNFRERIHQNPPIGKIRAGPGPIPNAFQTFIIDGNNNDRDARRPVPQGCHSVISLLLQGQQRLKPEQHSRQNGHHQQ